MPTSGLLISLCAFALVATPAIAAGQSPAAAGSTTHHRAAHGSVHMARSSGKGSAQDHMADQLNSQSLQAAMQGQSFNGGGAQPAGAAPAAPPPATTHP